MTLNNEVKFSGVGLHTGTHVNVRVLPSASDTGITFVRVDVSGAPKIKACGSNVVSTVNATTLGLGGVTVSTVEHLMAAFYGLGIDNAVVELDGAEIPALDGSAAPIVELMEEAGLRTLPAPKRYILIKDPIKVTDGDKYIELLPPSGVDALSIDYTIDFSHPHVERQSMEMPLTSDGFKRELTGARTFGFKKDIEALRRNGLAKGGSLDNAVVIGDEGVMNKEGLRFADEFVRHKILDLMGDISLLGAPVIGVIKAHMSGHTLNHKLVEKVLSGTKKWRTVELEPAASSSGSSADASSSGAGLSSGHMVTV